MENVIIKWEKLILFSQVETLESELLDGRGFYAIITGKVIDRYIGEQKLHYIGVAYEQSLRTRIMQEDTHPAYKEIDNFIAKNPDYKKYVRIGKISSKIQDRDSELLYKDIESCLIYDNKPLANTQCKDSYNGRQIKIENQGVYCSLKKISDSSKFLKKSAESYFGY